MQLDSWDDTVSDRVRDWQQRASLSSAQPPEQLSASDADVRELFIRKWRRVKSARFNAAKRLERQDEASTIALAMAGVFGFALPYFVVVFRSSLSQHLVNVLEFSGFTIGGLSLVVGLIEQARNYRKRSAALHRCGLQVNKCLRRLEAQPSMDQHNLEQLIYSYDRALEECEENHNDRDDRKGVTSLRLKAAKTDEERVVLRRELRWLSLCELFEIYRLYLMIWIVPSIVAIVVWVKLSPN